MNPLPKLTDQENHSITTSSFPISQYQNIVNKTKKILTRLLQRWDRNNSRARPSAHAMTPTEILELKVYSIELK